MRIHCLACGEERRLRGVAGHDGVQVTCLACGNIWLRNADFCDACGGSSMIDARVPLLQKSRGVQQSIIGYRTVKECRTCGAVTGDPKPPENYTKDDG